MTAHEPFLNVNPLALGAGVVNSSLQQRAAPLMDFFADLSWEEESKAAQMRLGGGFPSVWGPGRSYRLPGWDVPWQYLESGFCMGLWVNQYVLWDAWTRELRPNWVVKAVMDSFSVELSAPGTSRYLPVVSNISLRPDIAVVLDVYRPLGLPVGGSVAAQVNVRVTPTPSSGPLGNLTVPYLWVNVTVEALPEAVLATLQTVLTLRTGVILALVVVGCVLTFQGLLHLLVDYILYRRKLSRLQGPL